MSSIHEKADRIVELVAQRKEIDAELAEILGEKQQQLGGKIIGIPNPNVQTFAMANEKPFKYTHKVRSSPTCSKCGQKGHRSHYCINEETATPSDRSQLVMNVEQYHTLLQDRKKSDFAARDWADTHNVSLAEINIAVMSRSFQGYLIAPRSTHI